MKQLGQLFVGLITAAASSLLVLAAASLALLEGSLNILPSPTALPSNTPMPGETVTIMPPTPKEPGAPSPTAQPTTCSFPAGWRPYTVQVGDTLESLAEMAGISADEIYQKNCLPSRSLVIGSLLYLPLPTPTATLPPVPTVEPSATRMATSTFIPCVPRPPYGWVPYTVQYGDTLSKLSRDFNVSVSQLMIVNCLVSDRILAGQVLYVPYVPTRTPTRTPTSTITETPTTEPAEFVTLTIVQAEGGAITANPGGPYQLGTQVTIAATPNNGWSFTAWTGDCLGQGNPCTLIMNGAKTVSATFTQNTYTLDLTVVGQGAVVKNPDQATYSYGTVVTLTATPAEGWSFTGWSGACTGAGDCVVIMDGNKSVSATFTQNTFSLSLTIVGQGTVVKNPDQGTYTYGTTVTLTAAPAEGWIFTGWSGACAGTADCVVIMDGNKSVTATFTQSNGASFFRTSTLPILASPPDSKDRSLTRIFPLC